jgi:serine/threonine protein kinase
MSAVSGEVPRSGRFPVLAKYDVLEELGHGGMATVYRAHDKRLGRDVAVKVIHPHLRDSGEVARRFSIEAQAVAKLRHENIVEVYDVSAEGDSEQYLVVELLRGRTLRKMLQAGGALPPEVAAAIGVELLGALAHAHEHGVIHRDVKPENVIIEHRTDSSHETPVPSQPGPSPSGPSQPGAGSLRPRSGGATGGQAGGRISVKLTDFGIAKLLDAQGMTSTGQVLGSPAHMAPEQIEGQDVDARSDVFGMGVLLYECMVGHLPFEGNNPAQVLRRVLDGVYPSAERERPTVGRVWSQILDKALGRTPDERYDDAHAMREALEAELGRLGVTSVRAEIEAYCDDPKGFEAKHEKKTVALLCERALAARKRGDALAAAADYNRALAYAPHDPSLLRIVSSLHGAEARRRWMRKALPLVGTLLLGALAFGVTRKLRSQPIDPDPLPARNTEVVQDPLLGVPMIGTSAGPEASAGARSVVSSAGSVPLVRDPGTSAGQGGSKANVPPPPATKGTREIRFSAVSPNNIVEIFLDNQLVLSQLSTDKTLLFPVDDKPHLLKFACDGDYCVPKPQNFEPGQAPQSPQAVHLDLRPATLVINGNPGSRYALEDDPGNKLPLGQNVIPIRTPIHHTSVVEYPSEAKQSVTLVAGQPKTVSFPAAP